MSAAFDLDPAGKFSTMGPMDRPITIEPLGEHHWDAVRSIYLQGIATGNATFQQTAPDWKEWDAGHLRTCRMVARSDQEIVGWAALTPVSSRTVYRGVAEVSIYVAEAARGCGVGASLMARLIAPQVSGLCKPASFRKTRPASNSTPMRDSGSSALVRGSEA